VKKKGQTYLVLTVAPDGTLSFFEHGDLLLLADGLKRAVQLLHDKPELIRCATRTCSGDCGHVGLAEGRPC
jgi:hypothetical protein